jgi:hypothetical protein
MHDIVPDDVYLKKMYINGMTKSICQWNFPVAKPQKICTPSILYGI